MLFGYPLFWHSKLQLEIALSTTEAEYIAMSQALRNIIFLIKLVNELTPTLRVEYIKPVIKCKVYKDN